MAKSGNPRIAVLGAGPIGLEAALYARSLGLPVTVYERGRVGEHLHRWGHVRLFSPFGMNATPLGRAAILAENPKHEFPADERLHHRPRARAAYLEPLAKPSCCRTACGWRRRCCTSAGAAASRTTAPATPARRSSRFACSSARARSASASRRPTSSSTAPAPTASTAGWATAASRPSASWPPSRTSPTASTTSSASASEPLRRQERPGRRRAATRRPRRSATSPTLAEQQPDTWVVWLARGAEHAADQRRRQRPAARARPPRRAGQHAGHAGRRQRRVPPAGRRSRPSSPPGRTRASRSTRRVAGKPRTWEVDRVIANVGYTPDTQPVPRAAGPRVLRLARAR